MKNCDTCANTKCVNRRSDIICCSSYKPKVLTNADRIRAMSDEDLEDFLITQEWECDTYIKCSECPLRGEKGQCKSILEWLKQPAEGE